MVRVLNLLRPCISFDDWCKYFLLNAFLCQLNACCMFMQGRCLKVEYVDSLLLQQNLFISALSTCTYEWGSCTYDCTCERVEELYTCMRVCVYEQWNFYGFIMPEHSWVIDLCWSIYLFNMYVVNLRVLIIFTCMSVNMCWSIVCCIHVISTWKSWICLQRWKGDVDEVFHEMLNSFCLGKETSNYYTCLCLTWESVFWRGMFFSTCVWLMNFWHQDVRVHGDVHMMWNLLLWRRKKISNPSCVCDNMSTKFAAIVDHFMC